MSKMLRLSEETQKLLTGQQKLELPRLLSRLEVEYWRGRVSEGVKYAIHMSFNESMSQQACSNLVHEAGADGHYCGLIFKKPQTVLFFMPLFD